MKTGAIVILFAVAVVALALDPPVWDPAFQVSFKENMTTPVIGSGTTEGVMYYDSTKNTYRLDRKNGRYDRYCGSVKKFVDTPCSHIVTPDGLRFLYFSEKRYCCYCCASSHGCGLTKRDWVANGGFQGYEPQPDRPDVQLEKWLIQGLQQNLYYCRADNRRPYKIDMQPNDVITFDYDTYKSYVEDPNVFNLPAECDPDATCPFLSVCTPLRSGFKF
eukprot:TRINITY_DN4374_c0_g1_i1.p1 TRINITY_DN4374_c0_g1~~TRINITY_DN4374_c0_g1_i1.p1  ORF type:complete len:218 (+),score=57.99 TRINITY_DN4374_c0_g1_i1:87-740(+)